MTMTREEAVSVLTAFGRDIEGTGIQVCCGSGVPCSDDAGQMCCGQLMDFRHYADAIAALSAQEASADAAKDAFAKWWLENTHNDMVITDNRWWLDRMMRYVVAAPPAQAEPVKVLRAALKALEYNMTTIGNKNPCEPEWKALDRLARLVGACQRRDKAGREGPPIEFVDANAEYRKALADVLGEGE